MADLPCFNIEKLSFLVCDNDSNMCSILTSMLHVMGVRNVQKTTDGEEALKILSVKAPDVFICEWDIGSVSGVDLATRIRQTPNNASRMTPIIFLTAHTQKAEVTEARDAGITEFLAKPVSAETLYARICAIIMNPRAFIVADSFVGPDRRRQFDPYKVGMSRREMDIDIPDDSDDDETSAEIRKMLGL